MGGMTEYAVVRFIKKASALPRIRLAGEEVYGNHVFLGHAGSG